jgi:hypothetical protein
MRHYPLYLQTLTLSLIGYGILSGCSLLDPASAPTQTPDQIFPSANSGLSPITEINSEPTAQPSAEPSLEPTTSPTQEPSFTPNNSNTQFGRLPIAGESTPTPRPSPTSDIAISTPTPTPTPTLTPDEIGGGGGGGSQNIPVPPPTDDISVIERTTFNGIVYDDAFSPLDGVTIMAKSLNSSVPFEAITTSAGGTYAFNNAPSGVQIEIIASRSGFTTRRRVEVLKSNSQGDPNANKYDFGTNGSSGTGSLANALSEKPEVISVTPGRNASGIDSKTSFVLKFSEPMDRKSVEDTFNVRVALGQKLTIDRRGSSQTLSNGNLVWDESDFNSSWNSDDTEVTFTFADEKLLPADKDSNKVPDYAVSFAGAIKDKSGITRNSNYFKLTEGDFENQYKFAIRTDQTAPSVNSVIATTQEGGSLRGDTLKVRFSERMLIDTKSVDISSFNFNGQNAFDSVLNSANYQYRVNGGTQQTWSGSVVFDADDLTRKTVILLPSSSEDDLFERSDAITLIASPEIVDPAGNTLTNNSKTTTAG